MRDFWCVTVREHQALCVHQPLTNTKPECINHEAVHFHCVPSSFLILSSFIVTKIFVISLSWQLDFSLRIIVILVSSQNLPMPIVWLPLEVLKTSTVFKGSIAFSYLLLHVLVCIDFGGACFTWHTAQIKEKLSFGAMSGCQILKGSRKKPTWLFPDSPTQDGATECGFYVMRHMLNIVTASITGSWIERFCTTEPFPREDLYDIQKRWARLFLDLYPSRIVE